MDETELEEGEACYYKDDGYDDTSIDPDIALSYIGDKLQDILGHFQKDFEGGVSAENLGPKFGGYGSFLPTYQRSPTWNHQRTPPKVPNHNTQSSPSSFQLEAGRYNSLVSSSASQTVRPIASSTGPTLPSKTPSANDSVKQDVCTSSTRVEFVNKSGNQADLKPLKVRIKVGSDNLSTRNNAEIYSGLGLDVSPSSMDDSPTESERLSHDPQDAPNESPASILQAMTSFPVKGGVLLSPLTDYLIRLAEKDELPKSYLLADEKVFGDKKTKSEKIVLSKRWNGKDASNGANDELKKEMERDALTCEELVSNAMKLPLLSTSYDSVVDSVKGTDQASDSSKETKKGVAKEKIFSDEMKVEQMEPVIALETSLLDKQQGRGGPTAKPWEESKANSHIEVPVNPRKDVNRKGERVFESPKPDSNAAKGKKAVDTTVVGPLKQKSSQKAASREHDGMELPRGKEHSSSGAKKRSKGSQSSAEVLKENSRFDLKNKKSAHADKILPKAESEELKSQKDSERVKDIYKDFFGDMKLEEDGIDSLEMPPKDGFRESETIGKSTFAPTKDRLKDSEMVEESIFGSNGALKDRISGKKIDKPSTSEAYPNAGPSAAEFVTANGHVSSAAPTSVAPVVIQEYWVCCDKCQKWRLLPLGKYPEDLPEKWLCSMLDWLPRMNHCSISEEETNNPQILYGLNSANVRLPDQNPQNLSLNGAPAGGGKKKNALKEASHATSQDGLSTKKNLPASVKSRSINYANQSPDMNELDLQHLSKSTDFVKQNYSDGGDTRNLKLKSRRESDLECSRPPKRTKAEVARGNNEDWMSDHGGSIKNVGLPINDSAFKDTKVDVKLKDHFQDSLDNGKARAGDTLAKKRKMKETLETPQIYSGSSRLSGKEENSESDRRKEKKPRVSKESSVSKGSGGTDQKLGKHPQRSLGGPEPRKMNLGSIQPSVAATSSSSKVSGSCKIKSNFLEVKGSPVESVSSSPLRVSNADRFTSAGRSLAGRDDRRYSDAEDGGSDRSGTARKNNALNVAHRRSNESTVLDFQGRDCSKPPDSKPQVQISPPPEPTNHRLMNGAIDTIGEGNQYPSESRASDRYREGERGNDNHYHANGSRPKKSGKGSSSRSKDRKPSDEGKIKMPDSFNELQDNEEKTRDGKHKFPEKTGSKSNKVEKSYVGKKDSYVRESVKRESRSRFSGSDGPDVKAAGVNNRDSRSSTPKKDLQLQENDGERSSKRSVSGKTERTETAPGRGKPLPLPPSGGHNEMSSRCPRPVSGTHNGNGADVSEADDALKGPKQTRKGDGSQPVGSRHSTPNGQRAPSPATRRDSVVQTANNAFKEATDLKHLADRRKNSGSSESTGLYFQAVLKFLHGSYLLESQNSENVQNSDALKSTEMYISTAKLCQFCAHEYEKSKDMGLAALVYKCMEVAYMRVVYSSHAIASRDRHELQTALQMVPPGESPSSSASDIDNLNNPTMVVDKPTLPKGVTSPQLAGNHVIAARNRPNFVRLLNFAQNVTSAMEALKKSRAAFAAASASTSLDEARHKETLSSIKRALDFNFHDVDGLLRLVRLAMETINR